MSRSVGRHTMVAMAGVLACLIALFGYVVPAQAADRDERVARADIFIEGERGFNPANGVRSGTGTKGDPYVISDWDVNNVVVKDTAAHLVIKDNTISRLVLNWNGPHVTVVNNDVGDLRVNQNVKRLGEATGGLIAHNNFQVVGQLRHFDGTFSHNLVKPKGMTLPLFSRRAVLFDGFHGARFTHNTIFGYVDAKLHGHHHGSSFTADSHYHGSGHEHEAHAAHGDMPHVDHTKRYHEVFITNNQINAVGDFALLYRDGPHAVDDRTNASETDPALNANHTHFTRIHLSGNTLTGAGLMVDVFNAEDERHTSTQTGMLEIRNNKISLERTSDDSLWSRKDGISIYTAKDVKVQVAGNVVVGEAADQQDVLDRQFAHDAGILLTGIDLAKVSLSSNSVTNMLYGIRASNMTETVDWAIHALDTSAVTHKVYWDDSVANPPRQSP